mgnify:CR=1 FL=1
MFLLVHIAYKCYRSQCKSQQLFAHVYFLNYRRRIFKNFDVLKREAYHIRVKKRGHINIVIGL